jgi:hypothetical protein
MAYASTAAVTSSAVRVVKARRRRQKPTDTTAIARRGRFSRFLKENGLSLTLAVLFVACWFAQAAFGLADYNASRLEHGRPPVGALEYVRSGHLLEATFENWESEFFQMGLFVLVTVRLFQRGSSESKSLDDDNDCDADPARHRADPGAPWPVRTGGWALAVYEHSLSASLIGLFLVSFTLHAVAGVKNVNEEHQLEGLPQETLGEYVTSARFWFESFQNWQSEFLAVLAIVVLSIFLRERGSPQSKAVAARHDETG